MNNSSIPIRIPLLEIAKNPLQEGQSNDIPQGLKRITVVEISGSPGLPDPCYALKLPKRVQGLMGTGKSLGLFDPGNNMTAVQDIYAVGLAGKQPFICKVIKNDAAANSSNPGDLPTSRSASSSKPRRKSFMTPTPLHIPESQVSPIPDSAHEMIYLQDLNQDETLKVVSLKDVVWMHPLVVVVESPPG